MNRIRQAGTALLLGVAVAGGSAEVAQAAGHPDASARLGAAALYAPPRAESMTIEESGVDAGEIVAIAGGALVAFSAVFGGVAIACGCAASKHDEVQDKLLQYELKTAGYLPDSPLSSA